MSWLTKMNEARKASGETSFDGVEEFRGEFPNLADLLTGCEADGSMGALPAFRLTLFVHEGRLRFSVSSKDYDLWGVGELSRPTDGFLGIEEALARGALAWKQESPSKQGRQSR